MTQSVATLDDLGALAVFARVVDAGSFTAAAARLGLSKSVVSSRVSGLEARLGVRLLHRTTRRLSLTSEGAQLHEHCVQMLAAADEAVDTASDVGGRAAGLVRVTVPVGFGLAEMTQMLPSFFRRHPDIRVELALSDRTVDLVADGFDVAVRFSPQLRDTSLVARRIGSDRRVVCASPAYLARRGTPRDPDDLASHDCFVRLRGEWVFRGGRTVAVSGSLIADNVVVLRRVLLGGIGIASMPYSVVAGDLAAGRLVAVLGDHPFDDFNLYVVYPHRRHVPARVRVFVDHLVEWMKKVDWATGSRPRRRR
jgi:DNA-binding transcriptional LysR family regulator